MFIKSVDPATLATGFRGVVQAEGLAGFGPLANELNFYIGTFLFEDVAVTPYKGAASLPKNRDTLTWRRRLSRPRPIARAGSVRSIYKMGGLAVTSANAVSELRDTLDRPQDSISRSR